VNADVKRWAVGVTAAAVFVFIGWRAATLYERRRERLPAAQTQAQPSAPQKPAARDINHPKPVRVPTADISANPLFSDYIPLSSAASKSPEGDGVRLVAGFEGSPAAKITRASDGHFVVEQEDPTWKKPHFFLYRVEGATGQTVTIEIRNVPDRWSTINPVYSYTKSLDDLAAFASTPVAGAKTRKAANGVELPDTSGQSWHFIEDTKFFKGSLWFRQKFDRDAYVCMRYPYTPSYNERYLDTLKDKPGVSVIKVGISKEGRPLQIVKISEGTEADEQRKPCVLIYAREHADEQDSSWAAQGAIEFLISDATEAKSLRGDFTFLVIPMLDPDGAADGSYDHITGSFLHVQMSTESAVYSEFFKTWIDRAKRMDLVLNLHNIESQEGPHVFNPRIESDSKRIGFSRAFYNDFVVPPIKALDFRVGAPTESKGQISGRLGDWLRVAYGSLHLPLELNSQERHRHMGLSDLHQIGKLLVLSCKQYLNSKEAVPLLAGISQVRAERDARWKKYSNLVRARNAIEAEVVYQDREQSDSLFVQWGGKPPN
jgi:hypothetical protein